MRNDKPYLINKEEASGDDIIELAQAHGYKGYNGIYQTSIAAGVLRKAGYTIENNPDYEK